MNLVTQIIQINNRSNNSKYYLNQNAYGRISAFNAKEGNKTFQTTEEFLSWFKNYAISNIQAKAIAR